MYDKHHIHLIQCEHIILFEIQVKDKMTNSSCTNDRKDQQHVRHTNCQVGTHWVTQQLRARLELWNIPHIYRFLLSQEGCCASVWGPSSSGRLWHGALWECPGVNLLVTPCYMFTLIVKISADWTNIFLRSWLNNEITHRVFERLTSIILYTDKNSFITVNVSLLL